MNIGVTIILPNQILSGLQSTQATQSYFMAESFLQNIWFSVFVLLSFPRLLSASLVAFKQSQRLCCVASVVIKVKRRDGKGERDERAAKKV